MLPTTTDAIAGTTPDTSSTSGISGTGSPTSTTTWGNDPTSTSGAETGGDTPASTGPAPSAPCGNAQLDPGEECDLGLEDNSDAGACTLECKDARCGDEKIWKDHEDCDNGQANNDTLYGGCTTECKAGPRCGDQVIQGPEECDNGAESNGSPDVLPPSSVPCDDGCRYQARLVFLSSESYKGGELGGVEGAHLKCQNLAKLAGLDNSVGFKAWISDAQHSPSQDFKHVGLPYVRPDGALIAQNWSDLILKGPKVGIVITEQKDMLLNALFGVYVWTGTSPSGNVLDVDKHCDAWTNSSPDVKSRQGLSGVNELQVEALEQWRVDRQWTSYLTVACDGEFRLYCFEQ